MNVSRTTLPSTLNSAIRDGLSGSEADVMRWVPAILIEPMMKRDAGYYSAVERRCRTRVFEGSVASLV